MNIYHSKHLDLGIVSSMVSLASMDLGNVLIAILETNLCALSAVVNLPKVSCFEIDVNVQGVLWCEGTERETEASV